MRKERIQIQVKEITSWKTEIAMAIYLMAIILTEVQLTGRTIDKTDRHQPKRNTSEMDSFILKGQEGKIY